MTTTKIKTLLGAAIFFSPHALAFAQQPAATSQFEIKVGKLVTDIQKVKKAKAAEAETRVRELFDYGANIDLFALALVMRSNKEYVKAIEDTRVDKQVGGGEANAGSTSLTSSGSTPAILGLAVENGALTSSQSGTTITFRGNPVGIIKALGKAGFQKSYDDDLPATRLLRKFSYAVSFDASRGSNPGTFTGDLQQVSSYSFRIDILNKSDPRHPSYREKWSTLIRGKGQAITEDSAKLMPFLRNDPALKTWLSAAQDRLVQATESDVQNEVVKQLTTELGKVQLSGEIQAVVDAYSKDVADYLLDRDTLLKSIANGPILTFEYANLRQVNSPDRSNFKVVLGANPFNGKAELTANASLTILNSIPSGSSLQRVRDFQFSSQMDVLLGDVKTIGSFILTFAGKYERMLDNAATASGATMTNTKGGIGVGQIKFTIPVKGGGVKIPLSITFANRTELIKEREVRGNIGVTFDMDSIFARLKP